MFDYYIFSTQLCRPLKCEGESLRVTNLVTSNIGKRTLFLMKMVKLLTSSIGLLEGC